MKVICLKAGKYFNKIGKVIFQFSETDDSVEVQFKDNHLEIFEPNEIKFIKES